MGFDINVARAEDHAVEIASEAGIVFDLLLTDVIMPSMNGVELYNAIKPLQPEIKVLYMSGYTDNVIAHNGILEADVNFIQKPFAISDMFDKISSILNIKKAR
jgi:DNA-binding NtrC family response regulator